MKNPLLTGMQLLFAVALIYSTSALATTHVVQFGGSLGFVYSPSSFSASVGDTVKWEGDFSMHPLSSTSVPSGAATFHMGSGTSFSYVIHDAGTYDYRCDVHVSIGMVGSFTAAASAVLRHAGVITNSASVALFTSGGRTFGRLSLTTGEFVSGSLFGLDGRKLATVINTRLGPGVYAISLSNRVRGMQVFRISAGGREIFKGIL